MFQYNDLDSYQTSYVNNQGYNNLYNDEDYGFNKEKNEIDELYEKTQQLLDCPEMEDAHEFLLGIDFEQVPDIVKEKINDLYDLAVTRGFVQELNPANGDYDALGDNNFGDVSTPIDIDAEQTGQNIDMIDTADEPVQQPVEPKTVDSAIDSAYSVLYTATKCGEIRSGECYSNAVDPKSAKTDAISKLAGLGFDNIEILAVEFGPQSSAGETETVSTGAETGELKTVDDTTDEVDQPDEYN